MLYKDQFYYFKLKENLLSCSILEHYGFPVLNQQTDTVKFNLCSYFESPHKWQQKCRCKKTVSLLDQFWYKTDCCWYHPSKLDSNRIYQCCGRQTGDAGCTSSPTHVSSYVDNFGGVWYKTTKNVHNRETYYSILGLDCEFVYTTAGMEVARVSLVSLYQGVVYDQYVMPYNSILDYNTRFSGITPANLTQHNVKTLSQVQFDLQWYYINSDSILIGHGLQSDLKALGFVHKNIIDTSIIFPHVKGFPYRYSLKHLAKTFLNINLHDKETGHDSVQDAKVCLQLALLKNNILMPEFSALYKL